MSTRFLAALSALVTAPRHVLSIPNGLDVILSTDASIPTLAVNLWYHVGSANEEPAGLRELPYPVEIVILVRSVIPTQ